MFDNQGIQALLERDCNIIIASDASAVMRPEIHLSIRRQLSQLKRSQDITFSRVRHLCYNELELWHALQQLLDDLGEKGISVQKRSALEKKHGPFVAAHASISLQTRAGLPRTLRDAASHIRTDLDRFSTPEIAVLMYQGYSATDDLIRKELRGLVTYKRARAQFASTVAKVDGVDWNELSLGAQGALADHLSESGNRIIELRWLMRLALKTRT